MSYWPETRILAANSPSVEVLSRCRVSVPQTLFDTVGEYDTSPLSRSSETVGGGLITHPTFTGAPAWVNANTANSSVQYSLHAGAGNGAITGGLVVAAGFARYEAKDLNGANPIALSIVCTGLNNTANIRSPLNWAEIR